MARKINETKKKIGFWNAIGYVFLALFMLIAIESFLEGFTGEEFDLTNDILSTKNNKDIEDEGRIVIPLAEFKFETKFEDGSSSDGQSSNEPLQKLGKNEYYSGESFTLDYFEIIVTDFEYGNFEGIETSYGKTLLKVQLDIKNKAKVRKDFGLSNFVIIDSNEEKYSPKINANMYSDTYMKNLISLGASEQIRTFLLFELPYSNIDKLKVNGDNPNTYKTVYLQKTDKKRTVNVQKFEELVIGDLSYTVKFVTKTSTLGEYSTVYADGNFVTVNLEVSNKYGKSPVQLPHLEVKLLDDEEYSYSEDSKNTLYLDNSYIYWMDNEIQPKSKEDYNFLFEIPYNSDPSRFIIESIGWEGVDKIIVDVTKSYTKY